MKNVGVIGAGVMGRGVAQNAIMSGMKTYLVDISSEALEKAKEEIFNNLRFQGLLYKKANAEDPAVIMERLVLSLSFDILNDVDFVVENVPEKWETKKDVYEKIDGICKDECIFLVNTSCISITKVAALTKRPDRIIGVHFMNPVPMKTTVEGIRGFHTSEDTISKTREFLSSMGKECIVVNDFPGFVSNRLSHLLMNEAAFVVQDQVATPEEVDDIFKKCFSHKMGPLETADLIGLDTVVDSLDILYESYQDPKFRCCPLLRKMVYAGHTGRKSGQGFYTY